jgi:phosphatidylglycerophosphate synthase
VSGERRSALLGAAASACTLARIALAPLFAWSVAAVEPSLLPAVIVIAGVATDFVDGRLARAAGRASRLGRLFDHGADAVFLVPALAVLATRGRVPMLLPIAATIAFALYVIDGWRRGGGLGRVDLTSSPVGAAAGVLNYAIAAVAAATLAGIDVGHALYWSAAFVALVDLAAIVERVLRFARVRSSAARATRGAGTARPATRSSP